MMNWRQILGWQVDEEAPISKEEISRRLKELQDENWEFGHDSAAGYFYLYNEEREITIFAPYDAIEDIEEIYEGERARNWVVQAGDARGEILIFKNAFSLKQAFDIVKELKIELLK